MRGRLVTIIQDEILGKKYVPGDRIKEDELSKDLGISRTPIREALVILEQRGLVIQRPHRGTFVTNFTRGEIIDLLQVQAVLEGLAASLAAVNRTDEQAPELRDMTNSLIVSKQSGVDSQVFYDYDRDFHYKFVECSGSPAITRIVEVQSAQIYLCRYYTITAPNRFQHSIREHQEIVDRIIARDSVGAEMAARNHMESVSRDYVASGQDNLAT
jgi:DNA-binding GntR family transcriptional regulator